MTPKEYAVKIHGMIYHSAMGEGWTPFIRNRSIKIVQELKDRKAVPPTDIKGFWDKVIEILENDLK